MDYKFDSKKKKKKWQLDASQAILCGQDVIVDVGTGSGKTLCFSLPLLLDEHCPHHFTSHCTDDKPGKF
jgi:superfamily II DNA helicase RecQ